MCVMLITSIRRDEDEGNGRHEETEAEESKKKCMRLRSSHMPEPLSCLLLAPEPESIMKQSAFVPSIVLPSSQTIDVKDMKGMKPVKNLREK